MNQMDPGEDVEQFKFSYIAMGIQTSIAALKKTVWQFLIKFHIQQFHS